MTGSVSNGQVWIAKTVNKIQPVARSTHTYPTECEENLGTSSRLTFLQIRPAKISLYRRLNEFAQFTAAITEILLKTAVAPIHKEGAQITASIIGVQVNATQYMTNNEEGCVITAQILALDIGGIVMPRSKDEAAIVASITEVLLT